ncbi:unnamed protein product [Cylicocyclus nassatus]|uniref:Uncharacterized protein n=1 Tax=Cylicocyclus nassatus TaxID=53992 RepID=A0AA36MI59_CYLNA|nr:unnamed protein product [Cylicocyclus nassatus]
MVHFWKISRLSHFCTIVRKTWPNREHFTVRNKPGFPHIRGRREQRSHASATRLFSDIQGSRKMMFFEMKPPRFLTSVNNLIVIRLYRCGDNRINRGRNNQPQPRRTYSMKS